MIDDATIDRIAEECHIPLLVSADRSRAAMFNFARTIEQLARQEQREEDAGICDREISACSAWWDNAIEESERIANIIRASGKENSNE